MPTTVIDGITTAYEVLGSGPPLLMCSPGGFDAAMSRWRELEIYRDTRILDHLAERFTCVVYDRRESGASGGRVEEVTWSHYVAQAKGLLDHLGFERAHLMGGCMGCPPVLAFAAAHPEVVRSMVLFWPVGGARYRIRGHQRFADHAAFAREAGLRGVAELAKSHDEGFGRIRGSGRGVRSSVTTKRSRRRTGTSTRRGTRTSSPGWWTGCWTGTPLRVPNRRISSTSTFRR